MTSGYENIRRLAHEHVLPALQRFMVLASRLRGLSKYFVASRELGLQVQDVAGLIDCAAALQMVTHRILIQVAKELHMFQAYSVWLHHEITMQSVEEKTNEQIEATTKIDHVNALAYIQGPMLQSALPALLKHEDPSRNFFEADGRSSWQLYNLDTDQTQLPHLGELIQDLEQRLRLILGKVSTSQQRHVKFGPVRSVSTSDADYLCARIVRQVSVPP